jgi:hypothetical protein
MQYVTFTIFHVTGDRDLDRIIINVIVFLHTNDTTKHLEEGEEDNEMQVE